ncbi:unnamed protein product [Somion occarium]|uniref:P-loop containing nucleoside triphosphate hydrolase protein n=1 Tax=Somion occarium TaxID=3059160 RepID=A0ABP1CRR6_9APHY
MEQIVSELAQFLVVRLAETQNNQRLLVGISGVPASGKSTLAQLLTERVNQVWKEKYKSASEIRREPDIAILVGLDGWHLTRAQLDAFPDAKLAHDRRGAHWTFDGQSYVDFVRQLRKVPSSTTSDGEDVVYAPSFSHELKDPMPRAVIIRPHHKLVVIEGLYTFLGIPPWMEAAEMLDERWWIDIGEDEAEKRLVLRHVKSGVAKDLAEAEWRARENDAPNGRFIKENMLKPTRLIQSVEDPVLRR